jgi:hypothetical protein
LWLPPGFIPLRMERGSAALRREVDPAATRQEEQPDTRNQQHRGAASDPSGRRAGHRQRRLLVVTTAATGHRGGAGGRGRRRRGAGARRRGRRGGRHRRRRRSRDRLGALHHDRAGLEGAPDATLARPDRTLDLVLAVAEPGEGELDRLAGLDPLLLDLLADLDTNLVATVVVGVCDRHDDVGRAFTIRHAALVVQHRLLDALGRVAALVAVVAEPNRRRVGLDGRRLVARLLVALAPVDALALVAGAVVVVATAGQRTRLRLDRGRGGVDTTAVALGGAGRTAHEGQTEHGHDCDTREAGQSPTDSSLLGCTHAHAPFPEFLQEKLATRTTLFWASK